MPWLPFVFWLARDDAAWTFAKYADAVTANQALLRCQLAHVASAHADVVRRLNNERVPRRLCSQTSMALGPRDDLR